MRRTTILIAAATLALAGCSSPHSPMPTISFTATKTPELSAADQRAACVDAWAALLQENADADPEDAPADCGDVPEGEQLDAYMEGLQQRNQANRDEIAECSEDPSCTSVPIP